MQDIKIGGNEIIQIPTVSPIGAGGSALSSDFTKLATAMFAHVGMIFPFAGSTPPSGYLICDGSEVSKTTYADLFATIGTAFNNPAPIDSGSNFRIPDTRYRVMVGENPGSIGSGDTIRNVSSVGSVGGESRHTQTISEMPSHSHTSSTPASASNITSGASLSNSGALGSTQPEGGGQPFNLMQPYITFNFLIKY